MIHYDEIISVMDIVSKKMTNTTSTNVTSTSSVTCHSEKVNYKIGCYFFFYVNEHLHNKHKNNSHLAP